MNVPLLELFEHIVICGITFNRGYGNIIMVQGRAIDIGIVRCRLRIVSVPVIGAVTGIDPFFHILFVQGGALPADPNPRNRFCVVYPVRLR